MGNQKEKKNTMDISFLLLLICKFFFVLNEIDLKPIHGSRWSRWLHHHIKLEKNIFEYIYAHILFYRKCTHTEINRKVPHSLAVSFSLDSKCVCARLWCQSMQALFALSIFIANHLFRFVHFWHCVSVFWLCRFSGKRKKNNENNCKIHWSRQHFIWKKIGEKKELKKTRYQKH